MGVASVLREYVEGLGEESGEEKEEKKRLRELLKTFEDSV